MPTGIFGPKRLGDWKGYAVRPDPQEEIDVEQPDFDEAYRDAELAEQARWIAEAKPHVVSLACAMMGQEFDPESAVNRAVLVYCKLEQRLADAASDT